MSIHVGDLMTEVVAKLNVGDCIVSGRARCRRE